jgi:hypothetical protein
VSHALVSVRAVGLLESSFWGDRSVLIWNIAPSALFLLINNNFIDQKGLRSTLDVYLRNQRITNDNDQKNLKKM